MEVCSISIIISRQEYEYLSSLEFLDSDAREVVDAAVWLSSRSVKLQLTLAKAEAFREMLTEQLAKNGFDETYEPTTEGLLIENLIHRFYLSITK